MKKVVVCDKPLPDGPKVRVSTSEGIRSLDRSDGVRVRHWLSSRWLLSIEECELWQDRGAGDLSLPRLSPQRTQQPPLLKGQGSRRLRLLSRQLLAHTRLPHRRRI